MKYVLLVYVYIHVYGGPAVTTAEFDSKKSCEVAAKWYQEKTRHTTTECVPK